MNNHLTLNFLNKQDQAGFEPLTFQLPILHTSSGSQSHMVMYAIGGRPARPRSYLDIAK